ncbi:hypothetical protein GOBAR_DD23915 [Gossypium barbadense]|nr:hypothetical protein GOBAR_DD23915 [Gossypium barbadense]
MEERSDFNVTSMTEEINDLLDRLKFSEEESTQVISNIDTHSACGFESWAIGKIMATEIPNREAMYRVFKSLWFTKEEVDFVALKEGVVIVKFGCQEDRSRILNLTPWLFDRCLFSMLPFEKGKDIESYEFWWSPFWLRIYNFPLELMDRQVALDVGNALGELVAIDWKDRNGGWTEFVRIKVKINVLKPLRRCWMRAPIVIPTQDRNIRRNGVELVNSKTQMNNDKEESQSDLRGESEQLGRKGKERLGEEESMSPSPVEKRNHKAMRYGMGRCKGKRKRHRDLGEKIWRKARQNRMEGCLAVSSEGKSGGMALMWRDGVGVTIQNYSKYHIDSVVCMEDGEKFRFTGFYGQTESSLRNQAWDMLRRVKSKVNEGWIVGGDFNAILNDAEKEGGRRKPMALVDEFKDILVELSLTDVKTCNGWFTWTNNREGNRLIKERLDRFVISDDIMERMPFLASFVVRQSKSDHEAILIDLYGSQPKQQGYDPKVWFRYDRCWAKEREARDIISNIWLNRGTNLLEKMELIRERLGPWQHQCYRRMKHKIKSLEKDIGKLMDGPMSDSSTNLLQEARYKLGQLYETKEQYWATRSRSQWLREGDRNTRYFHVRASGHRKKNNIDKLKDAHGNWHVDNKEICHVARDYFNELFKTSIDSVEESDLQVIPECINEDMNRKLNGEFSKEEILKAFNQMDPRKASGIDGLSGSFYKEHWNQWARMS